MNTVFETEAFEADIVAALDRWTSAGRRATFWLRDDDAIEPTPALDRLLALADRHRVPLTLAVIPALSGEALAGRLAQTNQVTVAVHGWSHANHAPEGLKKQELGADRPEEVILGELFAGLAKLSQLHGRRFLPVLVPPWNRITPDLLPHLTRIGYDAISVYGPETEAPLTVINTQIDVIDWHESRGCRDIADLGREVVERLDHCLLHGGSVGLLTHHLVHDEEVWAFLDRLWTVTTEHPACRRLSLGDLVRR